MGKLGWEKSKVLAKDAVIELKASLDMPGSTACAGNWKVNLQQSVISSKNCVDAGVSFRLHYSWFLHSTLHWDNL